MANKLESTESCAVICDHESYNLWFRN